jgi:hypothetical protein
MTLSILIFSVTVPTQSYLFFWQCKNNGWKTLLPIYCIIAFHSSGVVTRVARWYIFIPKKIGYVLVGLDTENIGIFYSHL